MRRAPARSALAPTASVLLVIAGAAAWGDEREGDLLYLPMPAGESLTVENRLGSVRVRGWDEARVRIAATKHASSVAILERLKVRFDVDGGKLRVRTGVVFGDHQWRQVPLGGSGIDLVVDAPRQMALDVSTMNGDLDAAGFRAGARLTSEHGEIRAADLAGKVDTRSLEGRQSLAGIHGPLDANGIEGDLDLQSIDGATLEATVHRGQITAREVRSPVVRLRSTVGAIVFVGGLEPGGRYDLDTLSGDIRLVLRPAPFHLRARAPAGRFTSGFALAGQQERAAEAGLFEGDYRGGGATLELESTEGSISVTPAAAR